MLARDCVQISVVQDHFRALFVQVDDRGRHFKAPSGDTSAQTVLHPLNITLDVEVHLAHLGRIVEHP